MYKIHGWAEIWADPYEGDSATEKTVVDWLQARLRDDDSSLPSYQMSVEARNGRWLLVVHVVVNRPQDIEERFVAVLRELGSRAPGTYGVFHCRDTDVDDTFRVFVVTRGQVAIVDDPFFSPAVPTIEDP